MNTSIAIFFYLKNESENHDKNFENFRKRLDLIAINNPNILKVVNIYYLAFMSSIFSSLRKIVKIKYGLNDVNTMISYNIYKLSYIQ